MTQHDNDGMLAPAPNVLEYREVVCTRCDNLRTMFCADTTSRLCERCVGPARREREQWRYRFAQAALTGLHAGAAAPASFEEYAACARHHADALLFELESNPLP